eukprot:m.79669 g.79669  ORF g.79669 m.79669 type:complete len:306 (+) comp36146_c0_seq1:694-1611(+)
MVGEINSKGGVFSLDDFANYDVITSLVIPSRFEGLNVYGAPPPSGCAILQYILSVWSEWKVDGSGFDAKTRHLLAETFKLAFAHSRQLHNESDNVEHIRSIINTDFAGSYDVDHSLPPSSMSTTHFSVVDSFGNAIAYTSSNGSYFGSKIYSKSCGVLFNNAMTDFNDTGREGDLSHGHSYMRPQSRMSPIILVNDDRDVASVFGASGGYWIPTTVALALIRYHKLGFSLKDSIDLPRFHHQCVPNCIFVQEDFPIDWKKDFERHGHQVEYSVLTAVIQAVARDTVNGKLIAVCDCHKTGQPDGY